MNLKFSKTQSVVLAIAFASLTSMASFAKEKIPSPQTLESSEIKEPQSKKHDIDWYIGPEIGSSSFSTSEGSEERDSKFTYGLQTFLLKGRYVVGLSYSVFSTVSKGTPSISVERDSKYLNAEARVRIWENDFSPYIALGNGVFFQTVTTKVMGAEESASGRFYVADVGIGCMGRVTEHLALDFGGRFYGYSNVTGFRFLLSMGYYTPTNF